MEIYNNLNECIDDKWTCSRCPSLLGYAVTHDGKTTLRIKIKDQYIHVREPEYILVMCRKCSNINELRRKDIAEEISDSSNSE